MSILVNIPWDVSKSILSEWTNSLLMFGRLDVAFATSKFTYDIMRKLLQQIVFDNEEDYQLGDWTMGSSLYIWLCNIQLQFKHLRLNESFVFHFRLHSNLKFPVHSVQKLEITARKVDSFLVNLVQGCHKLKSLQSDVPGVLEHLQPRVLKHLQELCLNNNSIYCDDVETVGNYCVSLVSLSINGAEEEDFHFQELYGELVKQNPNLNRLVINARSTILKVVGRYCPNMRSIRLLGKDGLCDLDNLIVAVKSLVHLTTVNFNNCEYSQCEGRRRFYSTWNSTDKKFASVFTKLKPTSIVLPHANITQDLLTVMTTECGEVLTELELFRLINLTDGDIRSVLERCPNLINLAIGGWLDSFDLANIFIGPTRLVQLRLSVNEVEMSVIADILRNCHRLERLEIDHGGPGPQIPVMRLLKSIHASGRNIYCKIQCRPDILFHNGKFLWEFHTGR